MKEKNKLAFLESSLLILITAQIVLFVLESMNIINFDIFILLIPTYIIAAILILTGTITIVFIKAIDEIEKEEERAIQKIEDIELKERRINYETKENNRRN